jgi:hypothetical protein
VTFTTPFYAGAGAAGVRLHRYLDSEFIPRFLSDLSAGRLADPTTEDWWRTDRFSPHGDDLVLRLPIHRAFYLIACELVCDRPPRPALDPARIRSAGFVIRRRAGTAPAPTPGGRRAGDVLANWRARLGPTPSTCPGAPTEPARTATPALTPVDTGLAASAPGALPIAVAGAADARWMIEDGEPLGWQRAALSDLGAPEPDPDPSRRVAARRGAGGRPPARPALAYTGEETHPLHPVLVRDASGRPHTILYGFLPLGGQALAIGSPFDAADEEAALAADRALLSWPFGHRGRAELTWQAADGALVQDGRPSRACFELLELLVNRYHLGEAGAAGAEPLNDDLGKSAAQLRFVQAPPLPPLPSGTPSPPPPEVSRFSLLDYLTDCFAAGIDNPLAAWLAARRQAIDASGGTPPAVLAERLPRRPADGTGELAGFALRIACADAEEWRLLLGQRLLDQARRTGSELSLPKFRQAPDDLYQVIPFVRSVDDAGCERLTWAPAAMRSAPFRVAAPFDPDASRPTLIQMPGLGDLKRGLAKGAAMLVPPDTARLLGALNLDKGAAPGVAPESAPPGGGLGVQMICSFSLPIITLVAMILLMIMVMLLNIVFFWLPWVKICLPFPKLR